MSVKDRGFGSIRDPEQRKLISAKGGRAARDKGVAHKFTSEQAREAAKTSAIVRQLKATLKKVQEETKAEEIP